MSPASAKSSTADGDIFNLETYRRYRPGGFHPLHIDDELHQGRYRILHLLGRGTFAGVWLAENWYYKSIQASHLSSAPPVRYVAIKIMTTAEKSSESQILRLLQPPAHDSSGAEIVQEYVVSLFDDFEILGVNGTHRCIATEFLSPTPLDLVQSPVDGAVRDISLGGRTVRKRAGISSFS
ncbi:hypothetical protein BDD12DRAFT_554457 [Trichophaea hybrida]|nr:hypothetical protein BDD12DRAFT_554457 [Trichophaea hybrida]